jgi:hypothetical protein
MTARQLPHDTDSSPITTGTGRRRTRLSLRCLILVILTVVTASYVWRRTEGDPLLTLMTPPVMLAALDRLIGD